jgi:hypothetical protein
LRLKNELPAVSKNLSENFCMPLIAFHTRVARFSGTTYQTTYQNGGNIYQKTTKYTQWP